MISLVIRARNEGQRLGRCLFAVAHQRQKIDDVILVDNGSTDDTREIAESYGARIFTIDSDEFTFGRALNLGVRETRSPIVAILSAHCIPADEFWADYISAHFEGDDFGTICGVYGRQLPLPETSSMDARDLWTTFRNERLLQSKDFFFHNANSAIRRSVWEEQPFDEEISGVEDRAWAKLCIAAGFQIQYEPHARVYHYHGIHQGRNETRARRVAQAIRYIQDEL